MAQEISVELRDACRQPFILKLPNFQKKTNKQKTPPSKQQQQNPKFTTFVI